jgi:hypothetical protein
MIIVIPDVEKREGFPMTSTERRLSWVANMIKGYPYQPKSPEEAEGGYWFFETGKGWFLGDKGWTNDRIIDEDECGISVDGSMKGGPYDLERMVPQKRKKTSICG